MIQLDGSIFGIFIFGAEYRTASIMKATKICV